jgi:hypothetical protein
MREAGGGIERDASHPGPEVGKRVDLQFDDLVIVKGLGTEVLGKGGQSGFYVAWDA